MWRGSCAVLLSICLLKATPASSFGGALFVKPLASSTSASPTSDAASTATSLSLSRTGAPGGHARPSPSHVNVATAPGWSSFGSAHRPGSELTAKYDTLEEAIAFARAQGGEDSDSQRGDGEEEGGDGKAGDGSGSKEAQKEEQPKQPKNPAGKAGDVTETAKKADSEAPPSKPPPPAKPSAAKPTAKKSGGGMGGFNWGFMSAAAKPSKKPAAAAAKPASSDTDAKEAEQKAAEAEAAKEKAAAAAAAAAAKKEAEAAEEAKAAEEKKAVEDAKAAAEVTAAEEKAAAEASATAAAAAAAAAAADSKSDKVKAKEEEAAQKKAAADAAAAEKAETLKAKNEEAAQKKAAAKAAAGAAAAARADKIKAKNDEIAEKKAAAKASAKAAADAAAAAKAEKIRAKNEEAAQKKAAAKAAVDAIAAAKADAIKAKEEEAAQKKAAAKAAADAAAAAIADEAAKKRAASAEAAAATAAKERRAETIAAIARGDEPKVEKVEKKVKPKESTPPAEDQQQKKGSDSKKEKTEGDAAPAAAAAPPAAAAAAAAAPAAPAPAPAPAPADAPADAAGADAAKDVPSDSAEGSADAPADDKRGEAEKAPEKKAASKGGWSFFGSKPKEPSSSLTLSKPETIVVVTGATGRVGQLAVRRILELYPKVLVRAVVNDFAKGSRLLKEEKDTYGIKLEIMSAELSNMRSAARVVEGASAVVFCASGYAQNLSPLQRLANAVRLTINPKSVTDVEGVRDVALALKAAKKIVSNGKEEEESEPQPLSPNSPRFVLLSSAAVTRPNWSNEDKARYPLAADVPIVKLNPLNILTVKAEGEKELREVGIPYTVVRPCGLNDDHPRGRPLFSVGDTAAGRICREDVADVLVRCLGTKEATGKTFEVQTLPGLDKVAPSVKAKAGIDQALSNLPTDKDLEKDPDMLNQIRRSTYPVLTQLRPVPLAQASRQQE